MAVNEDIAVLTWNANTDSDTAGYRLYYGQYITGDGVATFQGYKQVGLVTTTTLIPFQFLGTGQFTNDGKWYFGISAFDAAGNESAIAFEVADNKRIVREHPRLIRRK